MVKTYKKINCEVRCKGCGVCAAVCPNSSITIQLNQYGEYQPSIDNLNCTECGRCADVCPMNSRTDGEVDLITDFTDFYVSHAVNEQIRHSCSSGGTVTQLLIDLIKRGDIDGTICVDFLNNRKPFFEPKICRSSEEVMLCRGSKYYPVEFSKILQEVKQKDERYALVCLPCVATAIVKARKIEKSLEKITYIICITCGHNKTANYLEFIAKYYQMSMPFKSVSFRNKGKFPFSNYTLKIIDSCGKIIEEPFLNGLINKLWCGFYFAQRGCLNCRDLFGVNGDVSCMDAWLYPYKNSRQGYNFVVAKNEFANKYLERNPNIISRRVDKQEIIDSQKEMFERKSKGIIPEAALSNIELSEKYTIEEKDINFILNTFRGDEDQSEGLRKTMRKLIYFFKKNRLKLEL